MSKNKTLSTKVAAYMCAALIEEMLKMHNSALDFDMFDCIKALRDELYFTTHGRYPKKKEKMKPLDVPESLKNEIENLMAEKTKSDKKDPITSKPTYVSNRDHGDEHVKKDPPKMPKPRATVGYRPHCWHDYIILINN
jgi:hypothetical protein